MIKDTAITIQNYYNKHGLWKTIHRFIQRIFVFNKVEFVFFEMDIENSIHHQEPTNKFKLIRAVREDIENAHDYHDGWYSRDEALRRFDEGHVLLVVKDEGRLIFFQWLEFTHVKIPHIGLTCKISDETVYSSRIHTVPSHRRKGVASKAAEQLPKYLKDSGYRKAFLVIRPTHIASIKVNKNQGAKPYQKLIFLKISFLKCYYIKAWDTRQRKVYLCFRKVNQQIWREFSKIELH